MIDVKSFIKDRNAALLSLNEEQIRAMVFKFNGTTLPEDKDVFWAAVHKAITGATDLPLEFRKKSKAWLYLRGLKSLDDGDL